MRYYSPYSSRTRPPLWPKFLIVLLSIAILGSGGWLAWTIHGRGSGAPVQTIKATVAAAGVATSSTGAPTTPPSSPNAPAATSAIPVAANGTVPTGPNTLSDPQSAADTYVQAWNAADYQTMYRIISTRAQAAITQDAFQTRYESILAESGITAVQIQLVGQEPGTSQYRINVAFTSSLVGNFTQENVIPLTHEGSNWHVEWTPSLIFRELDGNGLVRFFPDDPIRGRILDRKGRPLAVEGLIKQVGVVPGKIANEPDLLSRVSAILNLDQATIKKAYQSGQPTWFMPVKNIPNSTADTTVAQLNAIPGVEVHSQEARTYPYGTLAAHAIGYLGEISPDQLKTLGPKGYRSGDMIGQSGVEAWAEELLAGKRGGKLAVIDPDTGAIRSTIASRAKTDSQDVAMTIDVDIQKAAEDAIGNKTGSVVMLEPGTGNVLAIASHPTFDPNVFILGPTKDELAYLTNETLRPQLFRATQATYPSGSIFKVVTMTAGFEKGGFTADQVLPCGGSFDVGGNVYKDWNPVRHTVTYKEGLVQSCDVVFYTVGKKLDDTDPYILPTYARQFGLGQLTGIQGVAEQPGVVPDPKWKRDTQNDGWSTGDAINLSIGQGYLLVTPLQMANIYNSIANGGTIWQPRLVSRILNVDGSVYKDYPPVEKGKIPTSAANIAVMQQALLQVTTTPTGTATSVFTGFSPPIAGKTGTAEQAGDPHSWFASYFPAQNPQIAGVVMIEAGGEGGANAAPITRTIYTKYEAMPK
ncbi:MAG: penicillin-binding protein 2 [Chloroflexota bacterium]|nr:penicillin-binding protein 2 [Chloroflexota bacterium]